MKKRVVQALGCILAMTMVVGSLTACGGKSEKKAEKNPCIFSPFLLLFNSRYDR